MAPARGARDPLGTCSSFFSFYNLPHDNGGVLWFSRWSSMCLILSVHLSVIHCPYFHFRVITRIIINVFSPSFVYALILWRSGVVLLLGKFHHFLTELSSRHTIVAGYYRFTFLILFILKTCLYNFDPLKPHFCIVKLGFTGVYIIFLILL